MAARKPEPFSDQLRQAIRDSGVSRYAIWKATAVDQAVLSHFLAGHRGMSLDSIDKVAAFLDLRVVRDDKKRR